MYDPFNVVILHCIPNEFMQNNLLSRLRTLTSNLLTVGEDMFNAKKNKIKV